MPQKTKKKRHCIFTSRRFWGDSTIYWQSSQSSYTSASRLSFFLWSVTWLVICWYPPFRFFLKQETYKFIFLIILTGSGAGSLVSVSVINKVFFTLIYRLKTNSLCISVHLCVWIFSFQQQQKKCVCSQGSYTRSKLSPTLLLDFYLLFDMFHSSLLLFITFRHEQYCSRVNEDRASENSNFPLYFKCTFSDLEITKISKLFQMCVGNPEEWAWSWIQLLTTLWTKSAVFSRNKTNLMCSHKLNDEFATKKSSIRLRFNLCSEFKVLQNLNLFLQTELVPLNQSDV